MNIQTHFVFIIGASASSDIDVLVTHPTATKLPSLLHKIVDILTNKVHFITDTISIGDSKFMVS
jgi:predicted nucleotidyltransferase